MSDTQMLAWKGSAILFVNIYYFMYMGVLFAHTCTTRAPGACRGQRDSIPWTGPYRWAWNLHVGFGNSTQVLWKSSACLYPLHHLCSPGLRDFKE